MPYRDDCLANPGNLRVCKVTTAEGKHAEDLITLAIISAV